jgi:hypothetical protein
MAKEWPPPEGPDPFCGFGDHDPAGEPARKMSDNTELVKNREGNFRNKARNPPKNWFVTSLIARRFATSPIATATACIAMIWMAW